MSNLENIQRKISEGLSGWLLFEFHCFRGYIFSEKYLSYPISQILNSITKYKTEAEINHPCTKRCKGRPLQIDFVLSEDDTDWKYALESKWIGNTNITLDSMIWDLVRLQNLFEYHPNVRCYFILAGFNKKINTFISDFDIAFKNTGTKSGKLTTINSNILKFHLNELDKASKTAINAAIKKYPKFKLYSKIICRPAHVYPSSDTINMTFSTYIFEVLPPDQTLKINILK